MLLALDFEDAGELLEGKAANRVYFESQCFGMAIATLFFFESSPGMNPSPTNSRVMLTLVPQQDLLALRTEACAGEAGAGLGRGREREARGLKGSLVGLQAAL